jgi:hypothetical protein
MAAKVDHVLEEALALSPDDRAHIAAKLLASLPDKRMMAGPPRPLLALTGRAAGVWGEDSTATLERLRDEWR